MRRLLLLVMMGSCWSQRSDPGQTPCPNVCQYFWDDTVGQWQGLISIVPPLQLSEVNVQIKMTVTYFPLVAGYGNIDIYGGDTEMHAITRRVLSREKQTLRFLINFPRGQPTPRIKSVVINDKEFCPNSLTFKDTRAELSLQYNLKTGLEYPVANGQEFRVEGAAGSRPPVKSTPRPYVPTQPPYVPTQPEYMEIPEETPYVPPTRKTPRPYTTSRPNTTPKPYQPPIYVNPDEAADSNSTLEDKEAECSAEHKATVLCLLRCEQLSDNLHSPIQRRDTIKAVFPPDRPLPSTKELQNWAHKTLKLVTGEVSLFQVDREVSTVFIKLKKLELGEMIISMTGGNSEYVYDNMDKVKVILTFSGFGYRHIQVFNLPIEVPISEIETVVEQYGPVISAYDEVWNSTYRYNVKNGVRRLYMFVEKHIPNYIYVAKYRAFVTYEGQPSTCSCDIQKLSYECQANTPSLQDL